MEQIHFEKAINDLSTSWLQLDRNNEAYPTDWQNVRLIKCQNGGHYLRITRNAPEQRGGEYQATRADDLAEDHILDIDDGDEESLPKFAASSSTTPVTYDIIYSHTYQVPVLYIHRRAASYQLLTELYAPASQVVGIMGGLTLVDHPEIGRPVYFIHPCRTQEAVRDVLGPKHLDGLEWLMVWFGVIGTAVGLSVPIEVAEAVSELGQGRERVK
ncbi:Putative ubiquitin-like-conjugating enzyme Atg3/Atg10 [Septoria linicola]|uniref:Ubiquitin-like-conjugating enzyme ATG10 n=1 Tax=Septoria linicola TaxID=215465 RepID=A0A9Q9EPS1_9PEZI|nr:Putative ubiquitin-like-conjugating enzyme Atg3/Atg10 [Septoria linicola]